MDCNRESKSDHFNRIQKHKPETLIPDPSKIPSPAYLVVGSHPEETKVSNLRRTFYDNESFYLLDNVKLDKFYERYIFFNLNNTNPMVSNNQISYNFLTKVFCDSFDFIIFDWSVIKFMDKIENLNNFVKLLKKDGVLIIDYSTLIIQKRIAESDHDATNIIRKTHWMSEVNFNSTRNKSKHISERFSIYNKLAQRAYMTTLFTKNNIEFVELKDIFKLYPITKDVYESKIGTEGLELHSEFAVLRKETMSAGSKPMQGNKSKRLSHYSRNSTYRKKQRSKNTK